MLQGGGGRVVLPADGRSAGLAAGHRHRVDVPPFA